VRSCGGRRAGRGRCERVELRGGGVEAVEGELPAGGGGEVLEALQVVIEEAAAAVDVGVVGGVEAAGRELGRAGAKHGALGDQLLLAALAAEVGGAQLDPELGRAAGQDEDAGPGVEVQRLAAEGAGVEAEAERQRFAGHRPTVARGKAMPGASDG
jgi:hypothetical protein